MNIPFDIVKGKGPIIFDPPTTAADVDKVREFFPEESVPYVGEALSILRKEVGPCFLSFFFPFSLPSDTKQKLCDKPSVKVPFIFLLCNVLEITRSYIFLMISALY